MTLMDSHSTVTIDSVLHRRNKYLHEICTNILKFSVSKLVLYILYDICLSSVYRYKCTTPHTWPTFAGTDIDGCKRILQVLGHEGDVKYGKSKVFIRSPQTLFSIEETRSQKIPTIVLFLQKVQITFYLYSWS